MHPDILKGTLEEVRGLLDRRTFRDVMKEDIPSDMKILPIRLVLTSKSTEDGFKKFKGRFVVGGHHDTINKPMLHSSKPLHPI